MEEGLALQLFNEKCGRQFVKTKINRWPLLHSLMSKKQLPYIDYAVAEKLLVDTDDEAAAAFLCHLSLASREGHLCVSLNNGIIIPAPETLWNAYDEENSSLAEISKDDLDTLSSLIRSGAQNLPRSLFENKYGMPPLKCDDNRIYFFRQWTAESLFLEHFMRLKKSLPKIFPDSIAFESNVNFLQNQGKILPEQAQAILNITSHSLSILCGGPGTGKTYTAGLLLTMLWESLSAEQRDSYKMAIAAPTGKAASNLQGSLNRATEAVIGFPKLKAKTLHALLGKELTTGQLDADLIVVDESSMIDVNMMAKLFHAVKPGARLLLLGDPFQLPSVEAGSIFADIVQACDTSTNLTMLRRCMRTDLKSILAFAEAVNAGDDTTAMQLLQSDDPALELKFIDEAEIRPLHLSLLKNGVSRYPHAILPDQDPTALLEEFSKFRILSSLRQGPLGVDHLNNLFLKALAARPRHGSLFVAPIMISTNNHRLELFNGEVGLLIRKSGAFVPFEEGDYALFPCQGAENSVRRIPAVLLPRFEYAYCLSVHKSQGSEFDELLLLLPEGAELFGREGFYTGITRAKKHLSIWCNEKTVHAAIKIHSRRHSGIHQRLTKQGI